MTYSIALQRGDTVSGVAYELAKASGLSAEKICHEILVASGLMNASDTYRGMAHLPDYVQQKVCRLDVGFALRVPDYLQRHGMSSVASSTEKAVSSKPAASPAAVDENYTVSASANARMQAYLPFVKKLCAEFKLDVVKFCALIMQESRFKKDAVSSKGAVGMGQLMPNTAAGLGVKNSYDPYQNLRGAAKYVRQLLDMFGQNYELAFAAYNAGPGNVRKYGNKVPPFTQTREHRAGILSFAADIQNRGLV